MIQLQNRALLILLAIPTCGHKLLVLIDLADMLAGCQEVSKSCDEMAFPTLLWLLVLIIMPREDALIHWDGFHSVHILYTGLVF